jgi:hypothetical protein
MKLSKKCALSTIALLGFVGLAFGSTDPDRDGRSTRTEGMPSQPSNSVVAADGVSSEKSDSVLLQPASALLAADREESADREATTPKAIKPNYGNWVVGTSIDPMTEETATIARLSWPVDGWFSRPEIVASCRRGKTSVEYNFQESPTRTRLGSGYQYKAKFRWDDKPPVDRTFADSEGVSTTMMSLNATKDAKDLMAHDRLRVQYTKVIGGDQTNLDIELVGAKAAIAEVGKACGWL